VACPRCGRELAPSLAFCPGCGAPLTLAEEPAPRALDRSLTLDRRTDRTPPPLPPPVAAPANVARPPPPARAVAPRAAPAPAPGPEPGFPRTEGPIAPPPAADRSHWDLGAPLAAERAAAPARPAPDPLDLPDPEVDAVEVHLRRATSGRRALACAIDVVPFAVGALLLLRSFLGQAAGSAGTAPGLDALLDLLAREALISGSVAALLVVALFVYATLAHALAGATLGKWIARIRVAGPDGRRPSLGRSAVRSGFAIAGAALLGLGLLAAYFTRSGRGLHDLCASTWVVEA
jgi:uncharacterized RDD family membrane protein YckC